MVKITPKTLSLNIDSKSVEVHSDTAKASDLNQALENPATFKEFASDPKTVAGRYGLKIDPTISDQLKTKLAGAQSLSAAKEMVTRGGGGAPATVWAVASGSYSVASTKIAVAF